MNKNTDKDNFQKYYPRLRLEGIVRSALFGLLIGSGADLIIAIIAWCAGFKSLWLPIGAGIAVALVSGIVSYFLYYKPDINSMARRVDGLGLEERAVTMLEFKNDTSYIAALQRKDALRSMEKMGADKLRIRPSKIIVILAAVFSILGATATTAVGLAANDIIPGGGEIIPPDEPTYIEVTYIVYDGEGGEIIGETDQLVLPGEDAEPVVAVPFDGYVFKQWTDGSSDPTRQETDVTVPFELHAFFSPIGSGEGEEGEGDPGEPPEEDGDEDENAPDDDQSDQDQEGSEGESPDESGDSNADGTEGGGRWDDQNTIIDGNQYYYDSVETYKELAMQFIAANQEIPDYIKEFLEIYYDGLS